MLRLEFRLTHQNGFDPLDYQDVFYDIDGMVFMREVSQKNVNHYHAMLEIEDPPEGFILAFKKRLQRTWPGKTHCTVVQDVLRYLRYICKASPPQPVYNLLLDGELDTEVLHQGWMMYQEGKQLVVKERKQATADFKKCLLDRCSVKSFPDLEYIMDVLWQMCIERNMMPPADSLCVRYVEYVQMHLNGVAPLNAKTGRVRYLLRPRTFEDYFVV